MALLKTINQGTFEQSETAIHDLGDMFIDSKARTWVYSLDDGSGLTQYNTLANTAGAGVDTVANNTVIVNRHGKDYGLTNQISDASFSSAAGDKLGWLGVVDDGTGEGSMFVVEDNSDVMGYVNWNNSVETVNSGTGVTLAVGTSDIEMFHPHHCKQAVVNEQRPIIGVTPIDVTADYYFWRQVNGPCFVLMHAANPTVGLHVVVDDAGVTAGTLRIVTDEEVDDVQICGVVTSLSSASTAGKGAWIMLNVG